jgi:hypothetical protein
MFIDGAFVGLYVHQIYSHEHVSMPCDPNRPYNDLPALPPVAELDSKAILKASMPSRIAVAELPCR